MQQVILEHFFHGFYLRLINLFGLHHIFYLPFLQTALGGTLEVAINFRSRNAKYIFLPPIS